jgi:hypothetical protein
MKRLMISAFAAIALRANATTMLRSHTPSTDRPVPAASVMSLQGRACPTSTSFRSRILTISHCFFRRPSSDIGKLRLITGMPRAAP